MKRILAVILTVALCMSLSGLAFAASDSKSGKLEDRNDTDIVKSTVEKNKDFINKIKADKDFDVIHDDGEGNFSFAPSKSTKKSKDEINAKLAEYSAQYSWSSSMSDYKSLPYSDGSVSSSFSSSVNLSNSGVLSDDRLSISGSSSSFWGGLKPYYASSIDQSDSWSCNYIGFSCTISYPPGVGMQGSGSSCSINYPQLTGNYYSYNHTYGTISFKAYYITSCSQSDAATYRFGSSTVSPVCTDYLGMPSH